MVIPFESIAELQSEHVKIKNKNVVAAKIDTIIKGGMCNLQIVSDFDYTLTKQRLDDGKPVPSSFKIFEECKSVPPSVIEESHLLFAKYRPIEMDPSMPLDEKAQHMVTWWQASLGLLKGFPFSFNEIDEVAMNYKTAIREGTHEMLNLLNENGVPVLVFSAGIGNSITSMLNICGIYHPNVKIISNFLKLKDGILDGHENDHIIHIFNKNETAIKDTPYYDLVKNRGNVIVMGDSLGDAGMADGIPHSSAVLKIGFLFDNVEKNLPVYMDTFDIVLVDDQTMNIPRAILALILL